MTQKRECHVISNTHWDREWVKSFQESRTGLTDMFERLFDIFEKNQSFSYFHLDAQTIPLEDYLSLYPANRERLKKMVTNGRLLVGPWYTLPEMNSVDGECIVRNLLVGHRIAKEYGKVMKVGYTPTSTGQVSQLPQIYNGFGINTIIFYRGINQDIAPAEYIWQSPDGTRATGIRPPQHFSRCTFWGYVYLPVIHKYYDHIEESKQNYWYNSGFLFRMAEENDNEFIELDPVKYFDESYLEEALAKLMSEITRHSDSRVLLSLHGHDASFPHEETPKLIEALNRISEDTVFIHSSLEEYAKKIEKIVEQREENVVLYGEMRHVNQSQPWNDAHLYPGVISTKGRLKRRNRETENILIRQAEPCASIAYLVNEKYEAEILDLAWKLMLSNHAHDTINACSLDTVYHDAMHRYKQTADLCRQVIKRSLSRVVKNINLSYFENDDVMVTVFNLSPHERDGIASITVDMPHDFQGDTISIRDCHDKSVPVQVISRKTHKSNVDKIGFGKTHHSVRFDVLAFFRALPGGGYSVYRVSSSESTHPEEPMMAAGTSMENEFIRADIQSDGSLNVYDKESGMSFDGLNSFIDEGEMGNAWTPGRIPGENVYQTRGRKASVSLVEYGHLKCTFRVVHSLRLPVSSANNYSSRSEELMDVEITSDISLSKGMKYIEIETHFNNIIRDHRLKVLFPSGIYSDNYYAAMPFDVVSRPVPKLCSADWTEPVEPSDPQTGFIGVSGGDGGIAIWNNGLYEAEVINDPDRTIAITLLRSFYQHGNWSRDRWSDEEFQNPGEHIFNYAICPHAGEWYEGGIPQMVSILENPFIPVQHGKGSHGKLPAEHSFLNVSEGIMVSCIKRAEKGRGLIIRLYNPSPLDINGSVQCSPKISKVVLTDLEENEIARPEIDGNKVLVSLPHHKILTVKLEF